ncbi:prolyl hydroxylase EGLN3 isoform X1 [Nerophis lumbriciformis]|uniref:prolyl hydroxylase EGLN3 isoform X1 n=1 Tax=Nerophis lumbriciformis TaxID=546530 RepID=UPI002ADF3348|nr:egl nine homolog 3 isoform X1 [Nerophis lumbriciformis]
MPLLDVVPDLERLAADRVVPALLERGFCCVDGLLGERAGDAVLEQVKDLHRTGAMDDGRLAGSGPAGPPAGVRGDKIAWVSGAERECDAISALLRRLDHVITVCARSLVGRSITERSKAMAACYPGNGAGYVKHVDNPNSDGRCITCIYYLNKNWKAQEDGGVLRIFPDGKSCAVDIEPHFDRLLVFWSDRRNPHEVLPSYAARYAVTVWYFDSDERAEARRRFARPAGCDVRSS